MKIITLTLLLFSLLFSYQEGEQISSEMKNTLGMQKNKIYIVDFFASWCNSCEKEIPYISKVHKNLDATKVEIIGVDVDKDVEKAIAFQKELKAQNSLSFRVINDSDNSIIKEFKPIGMPALFYIKDGKVIKLIYGAVDDIDEIILKDLERFQK